MSEPREEQPLSGKELEPQFGPQMPAPHTLVGILRQRLEALVLELREDRGEVHVPEDVYSSVLRIGALIEGLQDYAAAFKKIAGEAREFVQDDLELAVGEQDGIPNSGMKIPDPDGTNLRVDLDTSGEYSFDLEAIMRGIAVQLMAEFPHDARDPEMTSEGADGELFVLLIKAMERLQATGKYQPQVTKVRALATEIARTDPRVASTITSTIKRTNVFKGIKIKREQPEMTNDGTKYQVDGATWKVDPAKMQAGTQALMDHESLLGVAGPGCYVCEEPYSDRIAMRRCKGEPRGKR